MLNHNPTGAPVSPAEPNLARDLLASIVVFLVALPLCMGVAIASGVPPVAGLLTGIVGGIVVGLLAGCPLQVSGPAAGLAVLVFELVQQHGLERFGSIVLLAGLFQLAAGLGGVGRWFRAVPPGVVSGMLAGIGVLILSSQFHVMVDDIPRSSGLQNLLTIPESIYKGVLPLGTPHHVACMTGLTTILAMMLWTPLRPRALAAVPAPLVGVVLATGLAWAFSFRIKYVVLPEALFGSIPPIGLSLFSALFDPEVALAGLALALVATAETLLSAKAVDSMHSGPRTNYDRELWAQGVGNSLCGLIGALPMTGVIVRSKANVDAGSTSRRSAVLHGLWILALVAFFPGILGLVPVASLAAVLVYTGAKLVDPAKAASLRAYGRFEVFVYFATAGSIVVWGLLQGVFIGVLLAAGKLLVDLSRLGVRKEPRGASVTVHVEGVASFLLLPRLAEELETIPAAQEVHFVFAELRYVDAACLELIESWMAQHERQGGRIVLDGGDRRSLLALHSGPSNSSATTSWEAEPRAHPAPNGGLA